MRKLAPLLLLRLAVLVALFGSAVLTVDYQNAGDPSFCGVASACMAVRASKWSHVGTVPLPAIGLSAFCFLLVLALGVREKAHARYVVAVAAVGGLLGATFLGLQAFQIGVFCKWCVMVDSAAIVAATAAVWLHRELSRGAELTSDRRQIALWIGGAALSCALPVVWGEFPMVPPMPPGVAALAVPGKLTVVSFTDFECPFCRKLHPVLRELVGGADGRIAIVRKMTPLRFHKGARPAALAYLCAPEPRREEMADALYAAPESALTRSGTIAIAARLGLDVAVLSRCVDAPETQAALDADLALAEAIHDGPARVPYTFVGPRVVPGFKPDLAKKAVEVMLAGGRPSLPVWAMLVAFAGIAAGVGAMSVRLQRNSGKISPP